ncbi:hypothetical protein CDD83_5758 [Cordyceps sp. RAO-2017]|nr:hypothetical protein CDD83_5758 [Cordyceps sp. RAO-2017]
MKRPRQRLTALVAAVTLVAFLGAYVRLGDGPGRRLYPMEGLLRRPETAADATSSSDDDGPLSKQMADSGLHPIAFLVRQSEREFDEMRARQSRTLREAVAEYRRRYGIPPPPLFDKWFEFATANGVQLVDERSGPASNWP